MVVPRPGGALYVRECSSRMRCVVAAGLLLVFGGLCIVVASDNSRQWREPHGHLLDSELSHVALRLVHCRTYRRSGLQLTRVRSGEPCWVPVSSRNCVIAGALPSTIVSPCSKTHAAVWAAVYRSAHAGTLC